MEALKNRHPDFPLEEVKKLYTENKGYFENPDYPFDDFIKNLDDHLWAFVDGKKLIGYIFMHSADGDSCHLSGNAIRKCPDLIQEAIGGTCGFYFETYPQLQKIYAETEHKWAWFALKRAGFKYIGKDKFIIERNITNG